MAIHPTIDKLFHQMWNEHRPELAQELFAEDFTVYYSDEAITEMVEFQDMLHDWFTGIPDITHEIKDYLAHDDKHIAIRWEGHGTHTGEFCGIAATGRPFHYHGITIFHLNEHDQVAKAWVAMDFNDQLLELEFSDEEDDDDDLILS